MTHNFYVATRFDQHPWARAFIDAAQDLGHVCTFDWPAAAGDGDRFPPRDVQADCAVREIRACQRADLFVLALPARIGAHIELGAALLGGATVVIIDREPPDPMPYACPFYAHPNVVARFPESDPVRAAERALECFK